MEWKKTNLGSISESIQTGPFGSQLHQYDYSEKGTPVIMPKDMIGSILIEDSIARVSNDHVQRLKKHIVKKGDIIYSRRGDVGRCVIISQKEEGWICGTGCLKVSLDTRNVLPSFVFYILKRKESIEWVENHAVGSTMPNLNTGILSNLPLTIPPLSTQQAIVSILSDYDTLIDINTKRIKLLEESARELYKEWFVRMRFPGHEKTKFVKGIPEGWKLYSIQELCDINKKTFNSKNKSEIIHYLDTSSITDNSITAFVDFAFAEAPSRARRVVKHNSILFSTVRPNLRHLGILKNPVVNTVVSTGFVVFDCKYNIANIVYNFISSDEVVDYCQSIAEGAVATYPSIKPEEIARLKIALPPIHIAEELNGKIETFISEQKNLQLQNQELAATRDRLLPRLLSGKLKVKA